MPPRGGRAYRQHVTFKQAIKERDGYRCQNCGGRVGDPGIHQIDVAHIIPYSDCHETKPKNVRVLCHSCNLKESGNGNGTAQHLNGPDGAVLRAWDRKADPDGVMEPGERRARALELQREHLTRIARQRREPRPEIPALPVYEGDPAKRNETLCRMHAECPELSYEQLGRAFGISWQRVHQIVKQQAVAS